jgi:hypothetical protein
MNRRWIAESIVVAIIVGCLVYLCRGISRGPRGDPIPKQPPNEANRVHRGPLSIVVPPNWIMPSQSFILAPHNPSGSRSKALITLGGLGEDRPPDLPPSYRKIEFRGQVAYERMVVVRKRTDEHPWSEYTLIFPHEGDWYQLIYGIAEERTALPVIIRQYLNTFCWDKEEPAVPPKPQPQAVDPKPLIKDKGKAG